MYRNPIMSCLAVVVVSASLVMLQVGTAKADDETRHFDIEAGGLAEALIAFSEQSELVLVVPASLTDNKTASATKGEMTPDEAISALLRGTGLEYSRDESGVTIRESDAAGRAGAESGGEPIAMLMYANAPQDMSAGGGSVRSSEAPVTASVEVFGTVTDGRTGTRLKGARVEVVETGQLATTDDLGQFRFPSVPSGEQTIRVSYLGYSNVVKTIELGLSRAHSVAFELLGGTELEEIVVYGSRSARAQSLNQERMAENMSSVVSSDFLGNFEGTTISEALRRVPGVAFERDAFTGDGINVTIRGLQADFNAVKLNGIELPETTGRGRTANLANILADSVDKITISKTLLANQDSAGTGGLIEIETKSPLDRPERYARFSVERGQTGSNFLEENYYTGTLAGTFGADYSLGLGLSVQYRDSQRDTVRLAGNYAFGEYLPLGPNGNPSISNPFWLSPVTTFPFEAGVDGLYQNRVIAGTTSTAVENLTTTFSVEKEFGTHTNLRLDYTSSRQEDDNFQTTVNFNPRTAYRLRPVEALGGEERQALGLSGSYLVDHSSFFRDGTASDTDVISLNGESSSGKWDVDYTFGKAKGEGGGAKIREAQFWNLFSTFGTPLASLLLPEAVDPIEGVILSAFPGPANGNIGSPLLNAAGTAFLNDPGNYTFTQASSSTDQGGESTRTFGELGARYNAELGRLTYVELGSSYEKSRFESFGNIDRTNYSAGFPGPSIDGAGIATFDNSGYLRRIGRDFGLNVLSRRSALDLMSRYPALSEGDNPFFTNVTQSAPRSDLPNVFTEETEWAAYIQSRFDIGKLELIGGVRMSRVDVDAVQIFMPSFIDADGTFDQEFADEAAEVVRDSATDTHWLPRVLANYRMNENVVVRAGYFRSVARPPIQALSSGTNVSLNLMPIYGPEGSQPQLSITSGNPALEPTFTDSFDLSFEYYYDDIGVIKLGFFYKEIENLFESIAFVTSESDQIGELLEGVRLPDDPRFALGNLPDNLYVSKTVPENSGFDGSIWGIEAAIERQLSFLPGWWGGLGFFANFTYTESKKDVALPWFSKPIFDDLGDIVGFESDEVIVRDVAFERQPRRSGTVAVTYNKYGFDAALSYTYQSRRGDGGLDGEPLWATVFTDEVDSLDLRAGYWFDAGPIKLQVFLEGSDLLRDRDETSLNSLQGPGGNQIINSTYFGGRSFRIGISGAF